jgi:sulfur-oxidizing protein SoxY
MGMSGNGYARHPRRKVMRPIHLPMLGLVAGLAWLAATAPLHATEDDAARAQRWQELRHAVFGEREIRDGTGFVALEAPERALDAALVPITIRLAQPRQVKALYLIIDENPSPLAGTFHFGPAADAALLRTRVRVDAYTLMHAVAETEDNALYMVERFVKAAGGCSAPSTKDQVLASQRLGQMKLKLAGEAAPGQPLEAQLLISHPNANGMQMDQVSRNYIPARFIQTIKVSRGDSLVFDLDADISLSEDPAITFRVLPGSSGPFKVEVRDSIAAEFKSQFDLGDKGS